MVGVAAFDLVSRPASTIRQLYLPKSTWRGLRVRLSVLSSSIAEFEADRMYIGFIREIEHLSETIRGFDSFSFVSVGGFGRNCEASF